MSYYLKEKSFRRGGCIYREGDSSEGIYFIKDGDFEVTKRMVQKDEESDLMNNETVLGFKEKRAISNPPSSSLSNSGSKTAFSINRCAQIMRNQSVKKRNLLSSKIDIRVSIIGRGQVVGLEDMSRDDSIVVGRHQATVTCLSDKGSAYFLSTENFFGFLFKYVKK
jgi:CRP-like cAMP-binding protein